MADSSTAVLDQSPLPPWIDDLDVTRNWRQPKRLSVSEWADQNRWLDELFASEPGPWRTDRAPYAREWMDSAALPWVRRVTLMASTQVGKSEAENNILGYYIHQRPSPAMFVMPNREASRLAAERRVMPMVRASDALTDELTDRAHDMKNREIVFKRSVLYMRSANSPVDLSSVPVRLLLGDETDKWPQWSGRDANPLSLAMERTLTFHDCVIVLGSTPTTRDGLICREHAQGDRRRYYVPCPHCGDHQVLVWERVKWRKKEVLTGNQMRTERDAWYECAHCTERIDDVHKREMLRAGVWIPEGVTFEDWMAGERETERNEHRSFHIWHAYSPWVPSWKIVAKYLDSKDDPALMMNFTNSVLAEVWEERVGSTSDEAVVACVDPKRKQFEVPDETLVITASVDVQLDYLMWQVTAWGLDEESYVIAQDRCDDFDDLDELIWRPWGAKQIMPRCIVVDSKYRREEVYEYASTRQPVVRMIAGVERKDPVPFGTKQIDKHPRTGKVLKESFTIWTVNVGLFKDLVAHRMKLALRDQEKDEAQPPVGLVHLPCDLPKHLLDQFSAEHKVTERTRGKPVRRWVKKPGRNRNESWDLIVYNAAAGRMIRVDTLRSEARRSPMTRSPGRKDARRGSGRRIMGRGKGIDAPRGSW